MPAKAVTGVAIDVTDTKQLSKAVKQLAKSCSIIASGTDLPMFLREKVSEAVTRTPPSTCRGPRSARSRPC